MRVSACQKSFDTLVDGEQAPPPLHHPLQFPLKSYGFPGTETKERFLLWKMGFSAAKIASSPPYTPPGTIKVRKGFASLCFFDSLLRALRAFARWKLKLYPKGKWPRARKWRAVVFRLFLQDDLGAARELFARVRNGRPRRAKARAWARFLLRLRGCWKACAQRVCAQRPAFARATAALRALAGGVWRAGGAPRWAV